jgi:hypothetical protein
MKEEEGSNNTLVICHKTVALLLLKYKQRRRIYNIEDPILITQHYEQHLQATSLITPL